MCRNEEPALVWALVTGTGAFLITTNIERPRVLAAEEDCTEFELHAVPWYSPGGLAEAAEDLAGGLKLAEAPAALRMPLTPPRSKIGSRPSARRLRGPWRGSCAAGSLSSGECDLAARIAGALEERLIFPSVPLVGGAERRRAFRHPVPTTAMTGRDALAVVVGVRGGLNVACSRTVTAGDPGSRADGQAPGGLRGGGGPDRRDRRRRPRTPWPPGRPPTVTPGSTASGRARAGRPDRLPVP